MRRAAPLFRTVVPAITQIPGTFGDVSHVTKGTIQSQQSSWEDNVDHQVISTGIKYEDEDEEYTTTTTTTTTVTSPTLYDLSSVSYSAENITPRLNDVYDGLSAGFTEHPASIALVQVVKDTTSDPAILNKIMKLDSFQKFVNILPSVKSNPQISATQREIAPPVGAHSTGTQTEYLDFLEEIDDNLQEITSQIISPVSSVTTTSSSPSSIPISSVDNTTSNSIPATSSSSTSSSSFASNSTQETSDFTEGSAGVPGNTEEISLATKVILPLAILAIAACVVLPNAASAINLLKSGIRYLSKMLISQPAF